MATYPSVDTAIYSLLSGASGITDIVGTKIYNLQAPSGVSVPYLIFYVASGVIPNTEPRDTINQIYRIESRQTSRAGAEALHGAVYSAVHEQALSITGWSNYWLVCESEQRFVENVSAVQYWRFVWDVRIRASRD